MGQTTRCNWSWAPVFISPRTASSASWVGRESHCLRQAPPARSLAGHQPPLLWSRNRFSLRGACYPEKAAAFFAPLINLDSTVAGRIQVEVPARKARRTCVGAGLRPAPAAHPSGEMGSTASCLYLRGVCVCFPCPTEVSRFNLVGLSQHCHMFWICSGAPRSKPVSGWIPLRFIPVCESQRHEQIRTTAGIRTSSA